MIILVLSDTHGDLNHINAIKTELMNADVVLHLGDTLSDARYIEASCHRKVCAVRGNCDFSPSEPAEKLITLENKKVYLTHGHYFHVKSSYDRICYKGEETEADIILFGHTHVADIFYENNRLYLNPGSLHGSRFCNEYSYGIIEINNNEIIPRIIRYDE